MKVPDQIQLYLRSMGKLLQITAIFPDDESANRHMGKTNDAVIAEIGRGGDKLIFLADKGDRGLVVGSGEGI